MRNPSKNDRLVAKKLTPPQQLSYIQRLKPPRKVAEAVANVAEQANQALEEAAAERYNCLNRNKQARQ